MSCTFSEEGGQRAAYLGIATHDEKMIAAARDIIKRMISYNGLSSRCCTHPPEASGDSYATTISVVLRAYGTQWYPYYIGGCRAPANVWFVLTNLFRGKAIACGCHFLSFVRV